MRIRSLDALQVEPPLAEIHRLAATFTREPVCAFPLAVAAVLQALACSAADVPAFLERRGLGDQASGAALKAACNQALLALLRPDPSGNASPPPTESQAPESGAAAVEVGFDAAAAPTAAAAVGNGSQPTSPAILAATCSLRGKGELPSSNQGAPGGEDASDANGAEAEIGVEAEATEFEAAGGSGMVADAAPGMVDIAEQAGQAAAVHGVAALVSRLLEMGADAGYVRAQDGATPLVAALAGGHFEAASLLLEAGAPPDPPSIPAIIYAAPQPLAAAPQPPPPPPTPASACSMTAKRKREDAAAAAAAAAAALAQPSNGGRLPVQRRVEGQPTPLVLAVAAPSEQLVEKLLAAGADPNRPCSMRLASSQQVVTVTPLIAAVCSGQHALVKRLLAAGADLHKKCGGAAESSGGVDRTSALSSAVLSGSASMVQLLVEAGACSGRRGGTQLGHDHPALRAVALAARIGRCDVLRIIYPSLASALQGGSTAMLGCLRRRTALHPLAAAAEHGHVAAVELLLELGAPAGHDGSVVAGVLQHTPLMMAAANGHVEVMRRLLAAGASPVKSNGREQMAAAMALQRGQLAAVHLLLRHTGEIQGAQAGQAGHAEQAGQQPGGYSPSTPAATTPARAARGDSSGPAAAARARPQLANASKAWQLGFASGMLPRQRPLTLAALEQERQHYQRLLAALVEAHVAGGGSASPAAARVRSLAGPASIAHASAGSEALLDALLACGVSVKSVDPSDGSFPLLAACCHGWAPLHSRLMRGADINQGDSSGGTALMLMAERPGMLATAQHLLSWHAQQAQQERRLDLLQRNAAGRDALGVAIAAKNRRFAELLLEHLATLQAEEAAVKAAGARAGSGARGRGNGGAATAAPSGATQYGEAGAAAAGRAYDLLFGLDARCLADINRPGSDGNHLLLTQVQIATCKQLRQVLALPGLDVNPRDASGRTPLMLAVGRRQAALVQELVATGRADVDARDGGGASAALLAAKAGDAGTMRVLLEAGADLGCADNAGTTPLMAIAAQGQHKVLMEIVRGGPPACLNAQDRRGWSALHHAAAAGHMNAVKVLRSVGADTCLRSQEQQTPWDLARQAGHTLCLPLLQAAASQPVVHVTGSGID